MGEKIEQKSEQVSCKNPSDQLLDYLNGQVSDEERMSVEEHLKRCKACREELKFLRAAKRVQQEKFTAAAFSFLRSRA